MAAPAPTFTIEGDLQAFLHTVPKSQPYFLGKWRRFGLNDEKREHLPHNKGDIPLPDWHYIHTSATFITLPTVTAAAGHVVRWRTDLLARVFVQAFFRLRNGDEVDCFDLRSLDPRLEHYGKTIEQYERFVNVPLQCAQTLPRHVVRIPHLWGFKHYPQHMDRAVLRVELNLGILQLLEVIVASESEEEVIVPLTVDNYNKYLTIEEISPKSTKQSKKVEFADAKKSSSKPSSETSDVKSESKGEKKSILKVLELTATHYIVGTMHPEAEIDFVRGQIYQQIYYSWKCLDVLPGGGVNDTPRNSPEDAIALPEGLCQELAVYSEDSNCFRRMQLVDSEGETVANDDRAASDTFFKHRGAAASSFIWGQAAAGEKLIPEYGGQVVSGHTLHLLLNPSDKLCFVCLRMVRALVYRDKKLLVVK